MDDKMLLFIVDNFTDHENEDLRNLAKKAWGLLRERGREIERSVQRSFVIVPDDAKSGQQMLDEIMEIIHRDYPEKERFLKERFKERN